MKAEQLLEDISLFIGDARAVLKEGVMMDLAGMDKRVLALCEQALLLPAEVRLRHADKLQELLNELTSLGKDLEAQRDALANNIRDIAQYKKAHTAYRVTEASDKTDKPEES